MAKQRHPGHHGAPVRVTPRGAAGRALEVGGVVQSVSVPAGMEDASWLAGALDSGPAAGYWWLLLPARCPRRALVLGLGGGTLATLLARRCPGVALVGVERDASVLAAARGELGLDAIPGLEVFEADAFTWVAARLPAAAGAFDYICVDLYEGARPAPGMLATGFLRQMALLLAPEGTVAVNLVLSRRLPEQIHRIERVFTVERRERALGNLVLHLRPRARAGGLRAAGAGARRSGSRSRMVVLC